jgi:hypothetical protein
MAVGEIRFEVSGVGQKFDDPFLTPSSAYIPDSLSTAFDYCMFLYYLNPEYNRAAMRVMRHFITDFEFPGNDVSTAEKEEMDDYLRYVLKVPAAMAQLGDDEAAYGNAFYRIYLPFDRTLVDNRSSNEFSMDMFREDIKFNIKELKYEVTHPVTGAKTLLSFRDRFIRSKSRISLTKLDPRDITIRHNSLSGKNSYIWKIPTELRKKCEEGYAYVANDIPIDMLKAIRDGKDFLFNTDEVFHFKAPTISGVSNQGWGLPPVMANYRSLHTLQVYRKIDEAIGLDYMVPFRIFTPEFSTNESGIVRNLVLSDWRANVERIIENRRKDKFKMHAFPFPLKYEEFGANGKQYTPYELVKFHTDSMLDAMGYPAELFRSSLQVQQVPTAVRLFENSFMYIHYGYTDFVKWVVRRVTRFLGDPSMEVKLSRPSIADSMDRQNALLQLSSAGEISRRRAYRWAGITDPVDEKLERIDEDMEIQKVTIEKEQELQRTVESGSITQQLDQAAQQQQEAQEQQQGSSPAGPVMQPGQSGVTPMDVQGKAQEVAQQWLQLPDGDRRRAMDELRVTKPELYAAAKQAMEEMRAGARSQGLQQLNQQARGGG